MVDVEPHNLVSNCLAEILKIVGMEQKIQGFLDNSDARIHAVHEYKSNMLLDWN